MAKNPVKRIRLKPNVDTFELLGLVATTGMTIVNVMKPASPLKKVRNIVGLFTVATQIVYLFELESE